MTERLAEPSPRPKARLTGVVYLLYFLTAILGVALTKGIVVPSDLIATAKSIAAHEVSYRLGFALGLLANAAYITLTALLYELFEPVDRTLSRIAAFFSLTGCFVQIVGSLFQIAPLLSLGNGPLSTGASIVLTLQAQAQNVALVFFAVYCLLIGTLIVRAKFLPRILGVLLLVAGLGWLTYPSRRSPSLSPATRSPSDSWRSSF